MTATYIEESAKTDVAVYAEPDLESAADAAGQCESQDEYHVSGFCEFTKADSPMVVYGPAPDSTSIGAVSGFTKASASAMAESWGGSTGGSFYADSGFRANTGMSGSIDAHASGGAWASGYVTAGN
ncbi:MAG: hypothetical protein MUF19_02460 [Candidatus Pacebacteria bacterium]|nr:hypothetical protein [Candidatus Paceibacterota bacterium]